MTTQNETTTINLSTVSIRKEYQPRVKLDQNVVNDYIEQLENGAEFPPIIVFNESDDEYILAAGYHRFEAYCRSEKKCIEAEIREFTSSLDVLKVAIESNIRHGARLSQEDKRRAVALILNNSEGNNWADNYVAKVCGVSNYLVKDIRQELFCTTEKSATVQTVKNGKLLEIKTKNIGSKPINLATPEALSKKLESKTYDLIKVLTFFRTSHDLEGVEIPAEFDAEINEFVHWFLAKKGA